jgi:hypothetical protein
VYGSGEKSMHAGIRKHASKSELMIGRFTALLRFRTNVP